MSEEQTANPPIMTHRDGPVFVKVWCNEHENGPIYSATIGKIYTHKETGEIRETRSLNADDILKTQPLLGKAYETISQERALDRQYEAKPEKGLEAQRDAARHQLPKSQSTAPARTRSRSR